jgi:hypothetical protein
MSGLLLVSRSAETSARFYPIRQTTTPAPASDGGVRPRLPSLAAVAQSIARSGLRWRRDLLLDHQLLDRHHRLVVEEEPEPAPEIQIVPAPVTGSI